jgi:ribose transport system substrate-binding protein
MRRLAPVALLLALLTLASAGCGQKDNANPQVKDKKKGTIGVSIMTSTNPFFNVIADNLKAELEPAGYDVIVVSGDQDISKQRDQVKDFLVRKVSAIVLCPCDSQGIGAVIKEANYAAVPVFTADLASLSKEGRVECHVATDNYAGGKEAGYAMIEALGDSGGKVLILDYKKAESCLLRVKGFKEVIDANNGLRKSGKIEIVKELSGEGRREEGYSSTQDAIQAHPDLAGIFAINDPSALGARTALETAGKADQVKIVGFDGQPEGKKAIKEGKIFADPIQYPDKIGRTTAQAILRYFAGEKLSPEILIPTSLYKKIDGDLDPSLK